MEFSTQLEQLMRLAQCNLVQLAEESGVSQATICRYRSGKRKPKPNSEHVEQIAGALSRLAERNGVASVDAGAILRRLNRALEDGAAAQQELNTEHFGALIAWMDMSYTELAPKISYDASTISRIRSGKRRPAEPHAFAESLAQVALARREKVKGSQELAELIGLRSACAAEGAAAACGASGGDACVPASGGAEAAAAADAHIPAHGGAAASDPAGAGGGISDAELAERLVAWLLQAPAPQNRQVGELLANIDSFNLDDYVKRIGYDTLKVPTAPFTIPSTKTYCGVQGRKRAEIEFLKTVATSKGSKTFTMFCNMDMDELAQDPQFTKRFLIGMAAVLKQGVRIEAVHTVDRPLSELIAGLQGWIPLYMTGQVVSHCLEAGRSPFQQLLYVSQTAVLKGSCVAGDTNTAMLSLSTKAPELELAAAHANALLKASKPLVETFTEERRETFEAEKRALLESGEQVVELSGVEGLPFKNIQVTVVGSSAALISKSKQPRIDFIVRDARMCSALCAMAWGDEDSSVWE
ncbi:MAG: helix-turn-helix domain-containing protein [Coriobacteriales bacterium]